MRIAVFLENINLSTISKDIMEVFLFDVEKGLVIAIGESTFHLRKQDYIIVWLLGKKVERVYLNLPDDKLATKMNRAGIEVSPLDSIRETPILKALLLKL